MHKEPFAAFDAATRDRVRIRLVILDTACDNPMAGDVQEPRSALLTDMWSWSYALIGLGARLVGPVPLPPPGAHGHSHIPPIVCSPIISVPFCPWWMV